MGIKKLLTISTSYESFDRIKNIIQKDEMIYGTIGIHPHETTKNKITSDIIVKNITENEKIIGIGETGLDFYYNDSCWQWLQYKKCKIKRKFKIANLWSY